MDDHALQQPHFSGRNSNKTLIAAITLCFLQTASLSQSLAADCNSNGIDDITEIASGTSPDCNANGVPDRCEIPIEFSDKIVITDSLADAIPPITADLDGDGDLDVISASGSDDLIAWYENVNGLGAFGNKQTITSEVNSPTSVFAADVDGDGNLDVISASQNDDKIAWYQNINGFGKFGPEQTVDTSLDDARSVLAIDLDGDGDTDILAASFHANTVVWYKNTDGMGTFGPQQVISNSADGATSVFAADLDGDGDADVLSASWFDDKVAWYKNMDGMGTFGPQQVISNSADGATSVFAADLDGDGDADVLSLSVFDDKIAWYENIDGLGTYGPERVIADTVSHGQSLFASDLDGDGDLDVLAAPTGHTVGWYPNTDGAGTFGPQQVIAMYAGADSLVAADIDRDGDNDVLSADTDRIAWYETTTINDCNANRVPDDCDISGATSTDCNGNGIPDECELVVRFSAASESLTPIVAGSPQTFEINSPPTAYGEVTLAFTARADFGEFHASEFIRADLNGTPVGDVFRFSPHCSTTMDILVIPAAPFNTAVAGRNAAINMVPTSDVDSICSGNSPITVSVSYSTNADCNYDSVPDDCQLENNDCNTNGIPDECEPDCNTNGAPDACDIASVGSADANTNGVPDECEPDCDGTNVPDEWEIASGTSSDCNNNRIPDSCEIASGTAKDCNSDAILNDCEFETVFSDQLVISSEVQNPWSVLATDLDGDGDLDVLSASTFDDTVVWHENTDGLGSFGPLQIISSEADFPRTVYAADLDGDGDQDVLSASHVDNKVAWYENLDGEGSFGPQVVIETILNANPWSVRVADLDGDNDLDVLSAYYGAGRIVWFENTDGFGTFGPQQKITHLAYSTHSVYTADLDGDGDLDVLYSADETGSETGKIAWYENLDGLGDFGVLQDEEVITYEVDFATSVFAADLDGDGDADVLSASYSDGKIAWYENINGLKTFGPQQVITTAAENAWSVFAADLDDDGDMDVLSASSHDGEIAWYKNTDGLGSFGPQQVIVNATGMVSVFAADLDGDGDLDALSASTGDQIAWYENITINDCNSNRTPDTCEPDTDLDGIINDCDSCAGGDSSGDSDANGVLDLTDYSKLEPCLSGPDGGLATGCECFDFDADGDNDLYDFANFVRMQ